MAKPLIYIEGFGHVYRDKIEWFTDPAVSGSIYTVTLSMVSGESIEATFDTEAKANAAISVLKNETEIDIIED